MALTGITFYIHNAQCCKANTTVKLQED